MTDARLRGEWLTAAAHDALSDAAYRVFHNALMHSAEQGTDGAIARRELRFLYPGAIDPAWLDEIEAAGFWETTADGYQFIEWAGKLGQSTHVDVDKQRAANRKRKQEQRERDRTARDAARSALAVETHRTPGAGPADHIEGATERLSHRESQQESRELSHRDVTAGVGEERKGQARPVLPPLSDIDHQPVAGGDARASTIEQRLSETLAGPPSPFCSRHPTGTDRSCRACGDARRTHDAWKTDHPPLTRTEQNLAFVASIAQAEAEAATNDVVVLHESSKTATATAASATQPNSLPHRPSRRKPNPQKQLHLVDGRDVCADGNHTRMTDGTCQYCEIRPIDLAALAAGATA